MEVLIPERLRDKKDNGATNFAVTTHPSNGAYLQLVALAKMEARFPRKSSSLLGKQVTLRWLIALIRDIIPRRQADEALCREEDRP